MNYCSQLLHYERKRFKKLKTVKKLKAVLTGDSRLTFSLQLTICTVIEYTFSLLCVRYEKLSFNRNLAVSQSMHPHSVQMRLLT